MIEMAKIYKFPSIGALRNTIHEVTYRATFVGLTEDGDAMFNTETKLPTLKFRGSVKMHGTNGSIIGVYNKDTFEYDIQVQSKNRVITPLSDNAGFATFVHSSVDVKRLFRNIFKGITGLIYPPKVVQIFGEWCGGNIQKRTGLNGLDKMFVIIGVKILSNDIGFWLSAEDLKKIKLEDERVHNILDFTTFEIDIDFNNPKEAADKILILVDEVENECPVAKGFVIEMTTDNVAYEENGKIWLEKGGDILEDLMVELRLRFKKISEISPIGINYIKFTSL